MPTRILRERAAERGVSLEQLVDVLQPVARSHFGPRLRMELSTSAERPLVELYAAFWVKPTDEGEAAIAFDAAVAHFGHPVELGDELVFQIFFAPDDDLEADAQDRDYLAVTGLSSVACGFWPVARRALAQLLALTEDPVDAVVQRALLLAVATSEERGPNFALRRGRRDVLFLKERVIVGEGEIGAGDRGRRDLVDGVEVEVTRREIPVSEVITGLFGSDALSLACEGSDVSSAQLVAAFATRDVHLARRTAFRTRLDRLMNEGQPGVLSRFAQLVASEREARFIL